MQTHPPVVSATVLSALPAYLKARGTDPHEVLDAVGIVPEVLSERQAMVPLSATAAAFELAARRLGDPAFGLSYAHAFPPGGTGLLGQIVMSAPTIRDMFDALSRYLQVHMSPVEARFEEGHGVGRMIFSWPPTLAMSMLQITGFYFASLILRLRQATGPTWVPLAVEFQHRQPEAIEQYRSLFGTRLSFERPENVVVVDATTLAKRMPVILEGLHEGLHESLLELSRRRLKEQTQATSVAARLQALLSHRLKNEIAFDLETVADEMEIPARALQWRLEQEHTCYEKVLLATRTIEATRYLRDTSHPLTRIASLLGFSELSAFTRWAQRRFGATPSSLRQRLRNGGALPQLPGNDPA